MLVVVVIVIFVAVVVVKQLSIPLACILAEFRHFFCGANLGVLLNALRVANCTFTALTRPAEAAAAAAFARRRQFICLLECVMSF